MIANLKVSAIRRITDKSTDMSELDNRHTFIESHPGELSEQELLGEESIGVVAR